MATESTPRRKRVRLSRDVYATPGRVCSATTCTRDRRPIFADGRAATAAVGVLREHARVRGVPIHAFCVMPDHAHIALAPAPGCDVVQFVGEYENLAQRELWRLGLEGRIWQAGFFDHVLRSDEAVADVVQYVLNNPVRAGLVETWRNCPWCGSLTVELRGS